MQISRARIRADKRKEPRYRLKAVWNKKSYYIAQFGNITALKQEELPWRMETFITHHSPWITIPSRCRATAAQRRCCVSEWHSIAQIQQQQPSRKHVRRRVWMHSDTRVSRQPSFLHHLLLTLPCCGILFATCYLAGKSEPALNLWAEQRYDAVIVNTHSLTADVKRASRGGKFTSFNRV